MSPKVELYDEFAPHYDLMVSWAERLRNESPFFRKLFQEHRVASVLDAACGTGMHAIHFAGWGYQVMGADLSGEMVTRARQNAASRGVPVDFVQAGFGQLEEKLERQFDAVVCLGNSLPHLLTEEKLAGALRDFAAVLHDGGLLLVQNRNYDRVYAERQRFMPLNTAEAHGQELLFFRIVDFEGEHLVFHIVTFTKEGGRWRYQVNSTRQRPIFQADMERLLKATGFEAVRCYGDFQFGPWKMDSTYDLIVVARKRGTSSSGLAVSSPQIYLENGRGVLPRLLSW